MPTENEYAILSNYWDASLHPNFIYSPHLHLNASVKVVSVPAFVTIDLSLMPNGSFIEFDFGGFQTILNNEIVCLPSTLLVGSLCEKIMNFSKVENVLYRSAISEEEKSKGGNMNTSVYDKDNSGSVDLSDALADGALVDGGSFV